ncbi:uncharacterized protein LOC135683785 [Rhopilema esculentum]|uniref:uncharacterized protein LOC135683785 n=1 Tax=Rhopilema esculentum TaxID=499914 RepID=UPI0031E2DAF1
MLHQHQNSRSYVASAAAATVTELYIGRSGNMKDKVPMGCHRPRSVCIHARNGQIDARALISKLAEAEAPITHIQRLGNGDMEITFPSIEVRNKFFSLPFVHSPRRIFHKPAELLLDTVRHKFSQFGQVLFARENDVPDTGVFTCCVTMKMIISEPIPSYVHLGPYCLLVRHDGQPQTCRKCDSRDHFAVNCNVKRCYNCGGSGHINVDCPMESQCQGCGSTGHHIIQCDTSWVVEQEEQNHRPHLEQEGKPPPATESPSMQEDTLSPRPSEEPPAPADKAEVVFPDPPPPLDWANSQPDDTVPPTTNKVTVLILCLLRQQSRHLTTTIIKPLQTAQKPMQTRGTQS